MNSSKGKPKIQGKKPSHKRAIVRSLVLELIRNERLQTTPKKAKILKGEFDRVVNKAKKNDPTYKRQVESTLRNEKAITKLYSEILPRLESSNSGYTQSAKTLPRKGDNADQVIIMIKGAEVKDKASRLSKALQRREKSESKKKSTSKSRQVIEKIRGRDARTPREPKKKESKEDVRRIST